MDHQNYIEVVGIGQAKGCAMNHFENANRCAELIASGTVPLLRPHLVDALIQSLKEGLKGKNVS